MTTLDIDGAAPFTVEQRIWLSGYLAGARSAAAAPAPGGAGTHPPVHVLYGTETGNAESVAESVAAQLSAAGAPAEPVELDQVTGDELAAMERVVIVCSTYGDGEMPDDADLFRQLIDGDDAPHLGATTFAVCALGDTAYDDFCAAGRFIDERLEALGATRALERVDCDVMWEDQAEQWRAAVLQAFAGGAPSTTTPSPAPESKSTWDRRNPFAAVLAHSVRLSGVDSDKEIRHHELALADSGIGYEAGDALAVLPTNDPALVDALLDQLGHDGETPAGDRPLREALTVAHEIVTPSKDLLALLAQRSDDDEMRAALGERASREDYLWGRDLLDLLRGARLRFEVEEFLGLLRPLQHRAYSISSSPLVSPDRIHLTVAGVRYRCGERAVGGVCSTHLADRLAVGDSTGIFLQPNTSFRPPADDVDMIMVGPGTGVAPFRGFLQEREARGATGRNWLLFGDRHREHDFLYESELTRWSDSGLLTRLDLAFSRDQAEKVYVQTRMREQGERLHAWLAGGAHLYVCGDATRMARDVDAALHDVVATHGGTGADGAASFVADLKREKRYLRDVY